MITIINLSKDIKELKKDIENYSDISEFENIESIATDYRFYSNQEILIYDNRQAIYSCSIDRYKNKTYITHIYNRNAELVYKYNINYSL